MPQNLTYEKSTLVQVMAWCRQAASYYLGQCWPRSMMSLGHKELIPGLWGRSPGVTGSQGWSEREVWPPGTEPANIQTTAGWGVIICWATVWGGKQAGRVSISIYNDIATLFINFCFSPYSFSSQNFWNIDIWICSLQQSLDKQFSIWN